MAKKTTKVEIMGGKGNTALALNSIENTREGIPAMLQLVKEQIKSIQGDAPKAKKTSGAPDGFPFSVDNCNQVEDLIKMHSFITAKEKAYINSVTALGLTEKNYPCKISGHSASMWLNDIASRLVKVKNKTKLDKLNKVKTMLENNLSEEMKFANDMKAMGNIIADLKVD